MPRASSTGSAAVKSDLEVAFIRKAARIVDAMHALVIDMIEPGLPKNVLIAEVQKQAILGADGNWGDYAAFVPMAPSGLDATAPHLTWDDRPFNKGEGTFFELGGCYRRYHAPLSRTVYLGKPPQKFLDAEKAVLFATRQGACRWPCPAIPADRWRMHSSTSLQAPWFREGFARRLFHRAFLSAGLGRAHHVDPARRCNRAGTQHDAAFHAGALA